MPASYIDKFTSKEHIVKENMPFFKAIFGPHLHGGCVVVCNSSFQNNMHCFTVQQIAEAVAYNIKSTGKAYFSLNTFKKRNHGMSMRVSENLWGLSAIGIDIDLINKNKMCAARNEFIAFLKMNGIPAPTIVVESGSGGYHLYWTFEHLPASMRNSVQAIKMLLVEKLVRLESDWDFDNLKVDDSAVDVSRLLRAPWSTHEDTGRKAEYEVLRRPYKFKDLQKKVINFEYNYTYLLKNFKTIIGAYRNNGAEHKQLRHKFGSPEAIAENRINELKRLAQAGFKFCNCREKACFILRNNAIVLGWSEEKTMNELRDLNKFFYEPLKENELKTNCKARKHYKMTNATIRQMLDLDDGLDFFKTYHRKTKGKKEQCKQLIAKIAELVKQYFSISQIAKILNVSISIVKRRRAELSKTDKNFFSIGVLKQVGAI